MLQNKVTHSAPLQISRSCVYQEPSLLKGPFVACDRKWNKATRWICDLSQDSTAAAFQSQTQGTNPAAASSWEQPKVPQPSTRHTFPTVCKYLVQAQTNIVAAKYLHPSLLLTPAQPSVGFCCYKPLFCWQQNKVCKNPTYLCKAQLTQHARTNLCCPHPITNISWFYFRLRKTPFSLLK